MSLEVRPAVVPDAHGISEVHVQAWREAYAHLVPAEDLARLDREQRERRWREILAATDSATWVATDGDRVVGFAGSSAARDADAPRDLELQSIYLLASHHGSGLGQRLLDAAVGDAPAYVWVAEDNPRARSFYARNRFGPDGTSDMHSLAGNPVRAVRLIR
jgi:L-amino acid N-acyltransferase YncA